MYNQDRAARRHAAKNGSGRGLGAPSSSGQAQQGGCALMHGVRPMKPQATQRPAPLGAERPPPGGTYVQNGLPSASTQNGSRSPPQSCAAAGAARKRSWSRGSITRQNALVRQRRLSAAVTCSAERCYNERK